MKPNLVHYEWKPTLREIDFNPLGPEDKHIFDPTVYWHYVNGLGFKCDAALPERGG